MTTNFKADVRGRMGATGEKYTEARRALLAEQGRSTDHSSPIERVTVHTTENGWPLAEANCEALTKAGRQCRNPFVYGQFWYGGEHEVVLSDSRDTRMLAQRRCALHVDHTCHVEVLLVMDDIAPPRFAGPHPRPVWQDPRSLDLIRNATVGRARTDALALYVALTEHIDPGTVAAAGARAGLSAAEVEAALAVLVGLDLMRDGTLVG